MFFALSFQQCDLPLSSLFLEHVSLGEADRVMMCPITAWLQDRDLGFLRRDPLGAEKTGNCLYWFSVAVGELRIMLSFYSPLPISLSKHKDLFVI